MNVLGRPRYRRLPPYIYLSDLLRGRRVLEVGCGTGEGARYLIEAGAAQVVGIDADAKAIEVARAKLPVPGLSFVPADYGALELEDRAFDVACVSAGPEVLRRIGFLEELRRVLAPRGIAIVCAPSGDRPEARGGISYHELVARLEPFFGTVRMIGVAPFLGFSLVEYAEGADVSELELDTSLVPDGAEPIVEYVALAGPVPGPERGFMVVQIPSKDGLAAILDARGDVEGLPAEPRVQAAEASAREALARVRELEAMLARRERRGGGGAGALLSRQSDVDLERRVARLIDERAAAEAELKALRERVAAAEEEIGRITARATAELERLRGEADAASRRAEELAARLADAEARAEAARLAGAEARAEAARLAEARAEAARAVEAPAAAPTVETPPEEALPDATELFARAGLEHEEAMRARLEELRERDEYIEELRGELERAEREAEEARRAEARERARADAAEAELGEARLRAARAEGELLRRARSEAATPHPPAEPDPRIVELETRLAEQTAAAEKAKARWKEAEAKSDDLWRKIGEMQRELEASREQAVENARAQRQAAQVALTRAMEEASKKLVSTQDQLLRTERERQELEKTVASLRSEVERQGAELAAARREIEEGRAESERLRAELAQLGARGRRVEEKATDDLNARLGELEEVLGLLAAGLREEELRLGSIEDAIRAVHQHTRAVPDPEDLERALVAQRIEAKAHEQELAARDEKIGHLVRELGERDAEIAILHGAIARAERRVSDVVSMIRRTRAEAEGRSALEIAASLDRLVAEAAEAADLGGSATGERR